MGRLIPSDFRADIDWVTTEFPFRGSIHIRFQLRALGFFLTGLGIMALPLVMDAIPGFAGAGAVLYVVCFALGLAACVLAWYSYLPWKTPARVAFVGDTLVFHHPAFAEPLEIQRSRIRVGGVDLETGASRFPLLDPNRDVPVKWLDSKDSRLVPFLRWDPVLRTPNAALLFSAPVKVPRKPFFSDAARVIKGDAPVYGLMFSLRSPVEFLRELEKLGVVRPMTTNDLPLVTSNVIQPKAETRFVIVFGLVALTAMIVKAFLWLRP
jgi:hypothetical protein